jgi:hypothetical protein
MNTFETSATVEEHGQVRVAGVPFAPGTEVEATVTPKEHPDTGRGGEDNAVHQKVGGDAALAAARDRMRELFQMAAGFRNAPRISREELYDRGRVH